MTLCRQHTSVHAHGCTVRMLRRVHNLPVPYTKELHLCRCGFQAQPLHPRQCIHIHWDGRGHSVSSSDTPCILWSIPRGTYLFQVSLFGSHVSWRNTQRTVRHAGLGSKGLGTQRFHTRCHRLLLYLASQQWLFHKLDCRWDKRSSFHHQCV